jgi:hypothetical protein
MIARSELLYVLSIIVVFAILGCNDISRSEKFDQKIWKQYSEVDGPDRDLMAEDLLKTHKLIGLTNKQMLQLLGPPENDTTSTWYGLEQEGEFLSPDPVSGKNLVIQFNKDSVITSAKIEEWHKH